MTRVYGPGMRMENLTEKLGMTEAELKTALEGGKTIQEIATEKGVELPEPKLKMHGDREMFFFKSTEPVPGTQVEVETSTSSAL